MKEKKEVKQEEKKQEKFNLWYSKRKAEKGERFFIPSKDGKEVTECTGITSDDVPPSHSSEFLTEAFLPVK